MENSKKISFFGLVARFALLMIFSSTIILSSCDSHRTEVDDKPTSALGFFIVNEGWFGHDVGSVNYYQYGDKTIQPSKLKFGNTTCYAAEWLEHYYFVSKQDKRLVKVDKNTMEQVAEITEMQDGRAFAGVTAKKGVVTTKAGAYIVDLTKFEVGVKPLEKTEKDQCGSIFVGSKYIFIISQSKGVLVYNNSDDFAFVKELGMASVGFAKSKDGSLWAANGKELLKINTQTLETSVVALPNTVTIISSWGAWNKGGFIAAPNENSLYFVKSGPYGGGNEIYKYVIGDDKSLDKPFIKSSGEGDAFYGAGINVDPYSGDIVATFTKEYGYNDNRLAIYNAVTGEEKTRILFDGYYFPAMIMFKL